MPSKKKLAKKEKKIVDDLWDYTKQANMQSDVKDMGYSDGIQYTGDGSGDFSYSFADLDDEFDMNVGTVSTGFTVDGLSLTTKKI